MSAPSDKTVYTLTTAWPGALSAVPVSPLTPRRKVKSPNEFRNSDGAAWGNDHRLVIGVDFGTTYSGVAFALNSAPEELECIKSWPGSNGINSDKVPTELSYNPSAFPSTPFSPRPPSNALGVPSMPTTPITPHSPYPPMTPLTPSHPGQYRWGFSLKPDDKRRLRYLKLLLDKPSIAKALPNYMTASAAEELLQEADKSVIDAVADYLAGLKSHTLEAIRRRFGESFMVSGVPIEWILTVPAVWSDGAKNATLLAAQKAGIGSTNADGGPGPDIRMISEPEAAAFYALKSVQGLQLHVDEEFVVCDAGGGTVDLISYKITSLCPLLVEECSIGTGGLCGSALLNSRFEEFARQRLGRRLWDSLRPRTKASGMRYWEEMVKRNFTGGHVEEPEWEVDDEPEEDDFLIPFPGLADDLDKRVEGGFMAINQQEVAGIFEPVVSDVIQLVQGQVDAIRRSGGRVAGIILVGGFGQNVYLYTRLKQHFNSLNPPEYSAHPSDFLTEKHVEVIQPPNAWTAVVRGAVLRGLDGSMVVSRRARRHYGTTYSTMFDASKHPTEDRYWSPLWERFMVSDRIQWHLKKGDKISERMPIAFHYTRNFRPGQSKVVEDDLIACDDDNPPNAIRAESTVVTICTLTTDLSVVPKHLFTRMSTSDGAEYEGLDFTLNMLVDSASLVFELRVAGVPYGAVLAEFK